MIMQCCCDSGSTHNVFCVSYFERKPKKYLKCVDILDDYGMRKISQG